MEKMNVNTIIGKIAKGLPLNKDEQKYVYFLPVSEKAKIFIKASELERVMNEFSDIIMWKI